MKGIAEVRLLKLIRTRCDWHRPTIITTQFSGAKLAQKFSDSSTVEAVPRRLSQFCDQIEARTGLGSVQPFSRAQMSSNPPPRPRV